MRLSAASGTRSMSYDARLAERVLLGGKNAEQAAMALLERCQPETLEAASVCSMVTAGLRRRRSIAWRRGGASEQSQSPGERRDTAGA